MQSVTLSGEWASLLWDLKRLLGMFSATGRSMQSLQCNGCFGQMMFCKTKKPLLQIRALVAQPSFSSPFHTFILCSLLDPWVAFYLLSDIDFCCLRWKCRAVFKDQLYSQ